MASCDYTAAPENYTARDYTAMPEGHTARGTPPARGSIRDLILRLCRTFHRRLHRSCTADCTADCTAGQTATRSGTVGPSTVLPNITPHLEPRADKIRFTPPRVTSVPNTCAPKTRRLLGGPREGDGRRTVPGETAAAAREAASLHRTAREGLELKTKR